MTESPLERPAEVYTPFTRAESDMLRSFVEDVRRLGRMSFFEQVPKSASIRFGEQGMRGEMDEPDDEALRAAITLFRQIYDHDEPRSFRRVLKLLKRSVHARAGAMRDKAIEDLDSWIHSERDALKFGGGIEMIFESEGTTEHITTATIIDAYFHGHYLHSGNPKSDLARRLDTLEPWPRFTLYTVMLQLRNVYWGAANVVDRVLAMPQLLDAEEPA